jgi:tRNA U34 5-methylaminomethyl-2-thiouridine-forming methyltransferase MnmC
VKRSIITTEDGSSSLFVPGLNEHYHSVHGAETESLHIFIHAAFDATDRDPVHVLEMGMGTGLNTILTLAAARKQNRTVEYHAVEKYPLTGKEVSALHFRITESPELSGYFHAIHTEPWDQPVSITDRFTLFKEQCDIRSFTPRTSYDVIYFDAFAPEVQPDLWSQRVFMDLYRCTSPGGVLTTYSAKGKVKRSLISVGYRVEKLPGPPGKREFLRAIR